LPLLSAAIHWLVQAFGLPQRFPNGVWILSQVQDVGDDNAAPSDIVENAVRRIWDHEPAVCLLIPASTLGECSKLAQCPVQSPQKVQAAASTSFLVVLVGQLNLRIGGEEKDDFNHREESCPESDVGSPPT
jgi:hypothetical protein